MITGVKLFNELMRESNDNVAVQKSSGRNPDLINARNNFLVHRFYFKTKIQRMQLDDAMESIGKELWLSKVQVSKIIYAKADNILNIKKQQPTVNVLRQAWPHIVW